MIHGEPDGPQINSAFSSSISWRSMPVHDDDSSLATSAPATADPISELPPRSPSSTTRHPLPRYQRRQINNDDLIVSIDWVGLKLVDCLSIAESALDTLVQRRPPSDPDLSEAAQETTGVMALPFGFTNAAAAYQHALRGRFADQVEDVHPLADPIAPYAANQTFCLKLIHALIFS